MISLSIRIRLTPDLHCASVTDARVVFGVITLTRSTLVASNTYGSSEFSTVGASGSAIWQAAIHADACTSMIRAYVVPSFETYSRAPAQVVSTPPIATRNEGFPFTSGWVVSVTTNCVWVQIPGGWIAETPPTEESPGETSGHPRIVGFSSMRSSRRRASLSSLTAMTRMSLPVNPNVGSVHDTMSPGSTT